MPPLTLSKIRQLIREGRFVLTAHAAEELFDDDLLVADLEHAVLNGMVRLRQTDRESDENKVLIVGPTLDNDEMVVVLKLSITAKLIIITVYRD